MPTDSNIAERSAFTILEFCKRNGISSPKYYSMRQRGLGPRELRCGGMIRISAEAERDWHRARENPIGAEAAAVAATAARLKQRSARAAVASVAAPKAPRRRMEA